MEEKKCNKCGRILPISEFNKHPKTKDGHSCTCRDCLKEYRNIPIVRAKSLISKYRICDRERGRGLCDLTPDWIVENIFSKPCAHCGESDWHKIGCNRLDNSKPHTMDNVEPCCKSCNSKLEKSAITTMFSKQFSRL